MHKHLSVLIILAFLLTGVIAGVAAAEDPVLLGWWKLNETSGATAADSSGNSNTGALEGSGVWVDGVYGGALQFDGSSYLDCGTSTTLQVTGAMTVTCWVNPSSLSGDQAFIGRADSYVFKANDTSLRFTTPGILDHTGTNSTLTTGAWQHVAVTFNPGRANGVIFYIDGAQTDSLTASSISAGSGSFLIANDQWSETYEGILDDVRVYSGILSIDQVNTVMKGKGLDASIASDPSPEDEQTDVSYETSLSWTASEYAQTHDVYFATSYDDVNDASRSNSLGVLVSQGQTETTYTPQTRLDFSQTYYWRIDEVSTTSGSAPVKGDVWSFTTEPQGYAITAGITATASDAAAGSGVQKAVDGSGLDDADRHSVNPTDMWMTSSTLPVWIQFEFDRVYKLDEMWVWNCNSEMETMIGLGAKDVKVEYSFDGQTWTVLEGVPEFAQATGASTYTANTIVDFAGVLAQYVRLTISTNHGGASTTTGLSEVRFFYIPVRARGPEPTDGETEVSVDTDLSWRAGREAASHKICFSSTKEAVADGTALVGTVSENSYTPDELTFANTYYWRITEVNEAQTVTEWPGDIWSFTTQEYATVDNFESYDDGDNRVYYAWIDGYDDDSSGSQVGYKDSANGTFNETSIVCSGSQAMPLQYDNASSPYYSETVRTFDTAQDWTAHGADTVSLHFRGVAPPFAEDSDGSILMNGIGADIWSTSDAFRFAYKSLNGDGSIVARVNSLYESNTWAKTGVMIRQSTDAGSTHAFMAKTITGGNGAAFQYRLTANNSCSNAKMGTLIGFPYWVKVERKGTSFSGYTSPDGTTWTQLGSTQTISMTNPVLIGLAVCSHDEDTATGVEFSDVTTTGTVTGSWQIAEIGVTQPTGNSIEPLYVTFADKSGKSTTLTNSDSLAVGRPQWQQWLIPLSDIASAGVKTSAIKSLTLGIGDKSSPSVGGAGIVYIDDIGFGNPIE